LATAAPEEQRYTFTLPAVRRSLARLAGERSHEQLPGYLALLHLGAAQAEIDADASDIHAFYRDYLEVAGAPTSRPFLQPFRSRGTGMKLSNKNTAGSYSLSSIRDGKPLSHVLEVVPSAATASGVTYRLKAGHEQAVLSEMLAGHKVPALALAGLVFRDRAMRMPSANPIDVVGILRDWLNIRASDTVGDAVFDTVFIDDSADYSSTDFSIYEV
jgi:hypothetical protein